MYLSNIQWQHIGARIWIDTFWPRAGIVRAEQRWVECLDRRPVRTLGLPVRERLRAVLRPAVVGMELTVVVAVGIGHSRVFATRHRHKQAPLIQTDVVVVEV